MKEESATKEAADLAAKEVEEAEEQDEAELKEKDAFEELKKLAAASLNGNSIQVNSLIVFFFNVKVLYTVFIFIKVLKITILIAVLKM
jgi:hypothetical protein